MKSIVLVIVALFAMSSVSHAAYNGAKSYASRPAASKASPASTSSFVKSKTGKPTKSSFKSGGYKK